MRPDSTTTRRRSSTFCTRRSVTSRIPARFAAPGGRSGRARATRSTSPASAWRSARLGHPGAVCPGDARDRAGPVADRVDVPERGPDRRDALAGAALADPANDPKLLAETTAHTWFQFDTGSGLRDADPLIPGSAIGQAFTAAQGTFAEVPDGLREKTTIRLIAEITNTATSLFGIPGQSRTTVLDHTFNDVDLVGRPITIGHFTSSSAIGSVFSAVTNTYSPFLAVGDLANPDPSQDDLIRGQDYQEFLTNFPFGTQIFTGLFLEIDLSGPGGPTETLERTLFDRIGYAIRQNGGSPQINLDPGQGPVFSPGDNWSIAVMPSLQAGAALFPLDDVNASTFNQLSESVGGAGHRLLRRH